MRRAMPWALLALVVLGAGAGAVAGAVGRAHGPGQSPAQWVASVLATTRRAATARVSYTQVTDSSSALLRATVHGEGVVDFARASARVSEVDHDVQFSGPPGHLRATPATTTTGSITVGGSTYFHFAPDEPALAGTGFGGFYSKSRELPLTGVSAELGLPAALNASTALGDLSGLEPVVAVRALGPATVGGVATTRYAVQVATPVDCTTRRPVLSPLTWSPLEVWVDDDNRMVQARSTLHDSGKWPAAARRMLASSGYPMVPSTITATLRFSDFGRPVRIVAPSLSHRAYGSSVSMKLVAAECASSRS